MKLEINGKPVEVDDSFAKLSPEDQQKTVNEIAASMEPKETITAPSPVPQMSDLAMNQALLSSRPVAPGIIAEAPGAIAKTASALVMPAATIAGALGRTTLPNFLEAAKKPWENTMAVLQTAYKPVASNATIGSGVRALGGLAGGMLTAPENAITLPYQMAAYEQEKIRANPTAPEYQSNPYAMSYRGEYPTQRAAGAANQRAAVANQRYGGLSAQEQDILQKDRMAQEMRRRAAGRVLPIAPGPM